MESNEIKPPSSVISPLAEKNNEYNEVIWYQLES